MRDFGSGVCFIVGSWVMSYDRLIDIDFKMY